ncbi:glycosyltransferase involved in cell wall biosynthesis [Metabacillus crassostreae]|uniref:glycosyltransferase family 4 protein n=1 Tax=Metabacillus crassostreae TaxID=929098 RepID=UPI0019560BC3|nr:glycosyltransferase family 4 protein [Metabacillus crassostreae]MBM7604697.1 glycosyltransferase involved in cell wall biosynthesis [Metabacillus crassostreae]
MNKQFNDVPLFTVLILSTEYGENMIGGLGRHVTDLVETGTNFHLNYIVVTLSTTDHETYSCENGIHIYRLLPWQKNPSNFLEYIKNVNFRFSQFVLQELQYSFDLIHVHDWLTGTAGCALRNHTGIPLVTTIHSTEKERKLGDFNLLIEEITSYENELINKSDQIIVCSEYMKKLLKAKYEASSEKIEIIPNGLIPEKYTLTDDTNPLLSTPYLLAMGRLVTEKGFHLLLEAFSLIYEEFPEFSVVIAGAGPAEMSLKQQVSALGLDGRVFFPGYIHERERNVYLKFCDMLIIPSLYEPFGIIALEGMIYSKPIISFDVGGLTSVLAPNRGIIVKSTKVEKLAEQLRYYLNNPDKANEIAVKGHQTIASLYQWNNLILKIINVYKKTVSFHRNSGK